MRGIYQQVIEEYKDNYFFVSFIPVIIIYQKTGQFHGINSSNEIHEYEVRCYGETIMSEYYSYPDLIMLDIKMLKKQKT